PKAVSRNAAHSLTLWSETDEAHRCCEAAVSSYSFATTLLLPQRDPCVSGAAGDGFHLVQRGKPLQRLDLDLTDALARQAEPAADLLERLRLGVDESVTKGDHAAMPLGQSPQRLRERLGAQGALDDLVGQRAVAGHEVGEDRVVG